MLAIRFAKISCVAVVGFYVLLVAFGNVTDYGTNYAYLSHGLDMDVVPPESHIHWRAITTPWLHHVSYLAIIAIEILTAALCLYGAYVMGRGARAPAAVFHEAKTAAVAGLTFGFLLYEGGFVSVAGEWFGMWQAGAFDPVPNASRIVVTMLGVLIFVSMRDEDPFSSG
ncbi:MAG TPA: DUF2165 domain-containing protein [Methylocystis sp.]|nr:DUF2165 domain-containing protein [Methylocystis sp.]HXZ15333.1 DUF2165 domain-containing protein [Roseiarcus sp.]